MDLIAWCILITALEDLCPGAFLAPHQRSIRFRIPRQYEAAPVMALHRKSILDARLVYRQVQTEAYYAIRQ